MQGEGWHIWMCSEDAEALVLIRTTVCYPIPVGFLVCIHKKKQKSPGPDQRPCDPVVNITQV